VLVSGRHALPLVDGGHGGVVPRLGRDFHRSQWQVEVVTVGASVGSADVGGDDVWVGRLDQVQCLKLAQDVADGAFGEAGVASEGGIGGEGVAAVRVGVVGQADEDDGEAGGVAAVGRDRSVVEGPVDGFDAHSASPCVEACARVLPIVSGADRL